MASNHYANKVEVNGSTIIDLTSDTVTPSALAEGYTAHDKSGALITGTATGGSMVIRDEQDSHGGTVRSITAGSVVQGTKAITENGTYDVAAFADASVNVPAPEPELQAKTATPSTSQQVITADSGYDGLSQVTVSAMPSGSATTPTTSITANPSISVNSSTGLITASVSGSKSVTPSVSAGYVSSGTAGTVSVSGSNTSQLTTQAAKTVTPSTSSQTAVAAGRYTTGAVTVAAMPSGTAGTPTATKGTVSNHAISVTPSVTNSTGYITGGTKTGTAVTVSASELVSGTMSVTENGTVDVTNYASVDVDVAGGVDMPVFTVVMAPDFSAAQSVTCSMTFAECMDYTNSGNETALVEVSVQGDSNTSTLLASECSGSAAEITFVVVSGGKPLADVSITSDGICSLAMQPSTVTTLTATANGTYTDGQGRLYSEVTVNVPSSGGSSYTLVYSTTLEVSTTSTTAVSVGTIETGDSSIWTSGKMVYVKIRDTAGWRNGYFYGMDAFLANNGPTIGATSSFAWFGRGYSMVSSNKYSMPPLAVSTSTLTVLTGYGVYPTYLYDDGSIQINARYSSSSSTNTRTIDGTFSVDVYLLDWPSGVSPFA